MKSLTLTIIYIFFAVKVIGQNWDIDLLKDINLNRNTNLDGIFTGITNSAAPIAFGVPTILLFIGLIKKDSALKRNGIYIVVSIITSATISSILKYAINKSRPFETYTYIQNVVEGGSPSFPSGHTTDAFALATSFSLTYPKWYIIFPSYTWAIAVGYSRMHLGVHYPSDVLVGAIIGSGLAWLSYKLNKWFKKNVNESPIIFNNNL